MTSDELVTQFTSFGVKWHNDCMSSECVAVTVGFWIRPLHLLDGQRNSFCVCFSRKTWVSSFFSFTIRRGSTSDLWGCPVLCSMSRRNWGADLGYWRYHLLLKNNYRLLLDSSLIETPVLSEVILFPIQTHEKSKKQHTVKCHFKC